MLKLFLAAQLCLAPLIGVAMGVWMQVRRLEKGQRIHWWNVSLAFALALCVSAYLGMTCWIAYDKVERRKVAESRQRQVDR